MKTKRKPTPEDPLKAIRKLIDKIQRELACTEAEAYFTLRTLSNPAPADDTYKRILAAQFYQRKKGCTEREAAAAVARRPELVDKITPWEWAVFTTRELIERIEGYRVRVEGGDFAAFFRALGVCGFTGFPIPRWTQLRSEKAFSDYSRHKVATTDEALGAKRPRYYRQEKARRDTSTIPWNVYHRCHRLLMEGKKTPDIFRIAGEEYGVSATIASEYYYALKRRSPTD